MGAGEFDSGSVVARVEELPREPRTVYDIETPVGTFCTSAGVVLKNTDSIYCMFDVGLAPDDPGYMQAVFEMSERAAEDVSNLFRRPVQLEFEKVMRPFMLMSKKRYAYIPYTSPTAKGDMEVKGLAMVRRDTCPFARRVLTDTVEAIMTVSVHEALKIATDGTRALLHGEAPVHDLVLSKSLRDSYSDACLPPHVALARRIRERSPESYPRPGDRVPYVLVRGADGRPAKLLRDGIEDPEYAQSHNIAIDHESYFKRQMAAPLSELFTICKCIERFNSAVDAVRRGMDKQRATEGFLRLFFPRQSVRMGELSPSASSPSASDAVGRA
jgi:DNA polymerase delta subunit 1